MVEYEIHVGFKEHGALTQFFRSYQIHDRPADGVENGFEIPPNICRLGAFENVHKVKSTDHTLNDAGGLCRRTDIAHIVFAVS